MMRPRAADEQHGGFALRARSNRFLRLQHWRHFFGNHLFHAVFQFLIAVIFGNFAQRFRARFRADKIHFNPGNAVFRFHHFGHVVN